MEDVKKGNSILAVSKTFKIPYATLYSRVKGIYAIDVRSGPSSVLTSQEEEELVQWIIHLSKRGFPVTKNHLLDILLQKNDRK